MVAAGSDATFSQLAAEIVTSRQFRNHAGRDDAPAAAAVKTAAVSGHQTNSDKSRCTMKKIQNIQTAGIAPSFSARRGRRAGAARGWNRCRLFAQDAAPPRPPRPTSRRCASRCIYFSNGVEPDHWWAKGSGAAMELGPAAAAARRPSAKTSSSSRASINQTALVSTSPHLGRMNMLSGATVSLDPNDIRVGTTHGPGPGAAASAARPPCPAWRSASSPTSCGSKTACRCSTGRPSRGCRPPSRPPRKSIPRAPSTSWWATAKAASSTAAFWTPCCRRPHDLQPQDQQRRPQEARRISGIRPRHREAHRPRRQGGTLEGWRPTLAAAQHAAPADELPQNPPDHMKLMLDLIVLAFQMDKTRIVTLHAQ